MKVGNILDALAVYDAPDIAEKTDFGYYLGYFEAGTDETGTQNCMIIEMRQNGNTTTRKFAKGINYKCCLDWNKRTEYEYKYHTQNI